MHKPLTMINGSFSDHVSVFDRGLHYGHGLFETMRVVAGQIPLLSNHLARLISDAPKVLLPPPLQSSLVEQIEQILDGASHNWQQGRQELSATVKILLTAGQGGRGYRAPQPLIANTIIQIMPRNFTPAPFNAVLMCTTRLGSSALAGVKHCSRIEQVLAASELVGHNVFEGLLCDQDGHVVEGVSSNIFLLKDRQFVTPALSSSGVDGVMRRYLLQQSTLISRLKITQVSLQDIKDADQLFVVNSNWGVVPVDCLHIDGAEVLYKATAEGEQLMKLGEMAFGIHLEPLGGSL